MRHQDSLLTINDFLHAVVIFGLLALSAAGVAGELSVDSNAALASAVQLSSSAGSRS